jgi:hypothetical protein
MFRDPATSTLIVLQITLTFWESEPQVELSLLRGSSDGADYDWSWSTSAESFGAMRDLALLGASTPKVPQESLQQIKHVLKHEPQTLPLWLRFSKPHGYLGALRWEEILGAQLERPVLRLPDLLERPLENRNILEVAICFDPQPVLPAQAARRQLRLAVETIMRASPRSQTKVHVFTSTERGVELGESVFDSRILIHNPANYPASRVAGNRGGSNSGKPLNVLLAQSYWSAWMSQALGRRSLDAVYFVCDARLTQSGPALMMSNAHRSNEHSVAWSYADAQDIGALLVQTGAWAAIFSGSTDNAGGALALFADALAHTRPLSVTLHPLIEDRHALALHKICSFIFSPSPAPAPYPIEGFMYCPPTAVAALSALDIPTVLAATAVNVAEFQMGQAPNWAAAAQRQSEMLALEQLRRQSSDILLASPESARLQIGSGSKSNGKRGSDETLEEIQRVIGRYLNSVKA